MIDIHSHILPGLDDGSQSLSQAVLLASHAHQQGVTTMVATPHSMNGVYHNSLETVLDAVALLTGTLEKNNIPMEILPGSEIHLTHDIISLYDRGEVITLNNTGRHILLELPPLFIIDGVVRIIKQLAERGVTVIIAHPERNRSILKNLNIIAALIYEGAKMQITAHSFLGGFGKHPMNACEKMIYKGVVSFIASDFHPGRSYRMKEAYMKTVKMVGNETADKIFLANPGKLMAAAGTRSNIC